LASLAHGELVSHGVRDQLSVTVKDVVEFGERSQRCGALLVDFLDARQPLLVGARRHVLLSVDGAHNFQALVEVLNVDDDVESVERFERSGQVLVGQLVARHVPARLATKVTHIKAVFLADDPLGKRCLCFFFRFGTLKPQKKPD
jgi:hypothetical protein